MLPDLKHRACPVCGSSTEAGVFVEQRLDEDRFNEFSYSSRKTPELMALRMARCAKCDVIYATSVPPAGWLEQAYRVADFDTSEEARFAADSYASAIEPYTSDGALKGRAALEVGAGTGAFLPHLERLGFSPVIGVEPSESAIAAADERIKPMIRKGVFDSDSFDPGSLGIFCSFQTLEHVFDPRELVDGAYRLLGEGGIVALVTHDYRAWLNQMLGSRSPIVDIEHLQLFSSGSLRVLLSDAGFCDVRSESLRNRYPARYWTRLLPIPRAAKQVLIAGMESIGLAGASVGANVGNLLTIAWKR